MLDAKNVISNLFSSTIKDDTPLDKVVDQQEDDKDELSAATINPFILLMTEILTDETVKEKTKNADVDEEPCINIETAEMDAPVSEALQLPIIEEFSSDAEPVLQLDDNIAMAWINSEHYQPVLSQSSTDTSLPRDAASNVLQQTTNLPGLDFDGELNPDQLAEIDKLMQEYSPELSKLPLENKLPLSDNTKQSEDLPSEAVVFFNELSESSDPIQITLDATELPASKIDISSQIANQQAYLQKKATDELNKSSQEDEALSATDKFSNISENKESLGINNKNEEMTTGSFNQTKDFNSIPVNAKNDGTGKLSAFPKPEVIATDTEHSNTVGFHPELSSTKPDFIKDAPFQSLTIQTPLTHSKWSNEFAEQVVWLGQQQLKNAVIKVNPQELGPLEISINMIKDSATITINSHSAQVREVLDQSLPRLRDMMMQQGLNLADVHIGSDSNSQTSTRQESKSQELLFADIEEETIRPSSTNKTLSKGIIDYFA